MPWALGTANLKERARHTGDTPQWEDRQVRVRSEFRRADRGRFLNFFVLKVRRGTDEMMGVRHHAGGQTSRLICKYCNIA